MNTPTAFKLIAAASLCAVGARVQAQDHHEFKATPVARLQVVETRGEQAVVEGLEGEVVLVRVGDRVGQEAVTVEEISRGCLFLDGKGGRFSICVEAPAVPRS